MPLRKVYIRISDYVESICCSTHAVLTSSALNPFESFFKPIIVEEDVFGAILFKRSAAPFDSV